MGKQRSFFDNELEQDMTAKRGPTNNKPSPFGAQEAQRLKVNGKARAAEAQPSNLALARNVAHEIGMKQEHVNADDVGEVLWERHKIETLGAASSSTFTDGSWEFTGIRVFSKRKKNRGRELKVYRLKGRIK